MAGIAFVAAAPLRIFTGGAPPPALARRRRPRCALAPLADAAGEASRRRVLKAAEGGKVVRAERGKRRETQGRKREEERRVKEVERGKREAAEAKAKVAEAKAKAAEVKAKASEAKASEEAKAKAVEAKAAEAKAAEAKKAAEAEVKVRAEAGAKAKAAVEVKAKATAAVEAKRKLAEARDEAGSSGAADLMKKSRELGKGEAVGELVSPKGVGDNPSPLAGTDGIDVALDGKIVIDGATVESEEFFVASQDSPNVSPPPLTDGSTSADSGGSVVGTPLAAAEGVGDEAMLLFTEGEHAFLFSDTSDPSKIKLSTVEDVTSVSAPQTATPSLAPKPAEKPRAGASDGAGGTGEPVKVGESVRVREGVGKSSAGDIVGTPRFFSLRRVTQVGESARKEISRAMARGSTVEDSKAGKISSRREFVRFAGEGLLIITLMLLLQTGVSRTMRWIHSRLDRVDSPSGKKQNFPYEQSVYECMQKPLEFLSVFIVGTALAEAVSRPLAATGLVRYIRTLRELGVIFSATWFILRWIERISLRFAVDKRIDKAQVDASSRVATVLTTVIAILISLDTVGVNVQTVLAFGGIG